LALAVADLERYAAENDFTAYTLPIVSKLKAVLIDIANAPREGNTRAILQQIRSSFLDGGWERYRVKAARDLVAGILERLSAAEEVKKEDAAAAFGELLANGLNAVGPSLPDLNEEDGDDEPGGEEKKAEVPR
jgi:hypothetical protein